MRKKIASALLALILSIAFNFIVFAGTAEIELSGENRYKAVRLTPQIYNAANKDLSDILVKDSGGEAAPYFIHSGEQHVDKSRQSHAMELINSYLKDDNFYFDYKLANIRDRDTAATSIEFHTNNTGFAKTVALYGSYDNIHWEFVQDDKLYQVDDVSKLYIAFAKPEKYTHYRIRLDNNLERIAFDAVNLIYSTETNKETYFIESLSHDYSIENDGKYTNIIVEGLKNLRLCDITIHTDSMFQRSVRAPHAAMKELYNLSFDGTSYEDTTIPLHRQVSTDEKYIIIIFNRDDRPIDINGITVRYYADEIVFEAIAGENYTLEFGADHTKTAPIYDMERYKNEILRRGIDRVAIGEIQFAAPESTPEERDYSLIFNIVVVVVAVLLGVIIFLRLKRKQLP